MKKKPHAKKTSKKSISISELSSRLNRALDTLANVETEPTVAQESFTSDNPQAPSPAPDTSSRPTLLDAAAQVLRKSAQPMSCKQLIDAIIADGLWQPTRRGKTPANTLHAALCADIKKNPQASRFEKTGRGLFTLRAS